VRSLLQFGKPKVVSLIADKIKANQIDGLEIFAGQILGLYDQVASLTQASASAQLIASVTPSATDSSQLTSLLSYIKDGTLIVTESAEFKGDTIFHALAEFIGNIIFRGDVSFFGRPTFNKDTAGFAIIKKGEKIVDVEYEKEYASTPIVTANIIWDIDRDTLATLESIDALFLAKWDHLIASSNTRGFTIVLEEPAVTDLKFNWTATAVHEAKTFESRTSTTPILDTSTTEPPQQPLQEDLLQSPTDQLNLSPTPTPSQAPNQLRTQNLEPSTTPIPSPFLTPTSELTITVLPNDLGFVRIREGPSSSTAELGQIPVDTTLTYTEIDNGWYYVSYQGTGGWVSGTYVEVSGI